MPAGCREPASGFEGDIASAEFRPAGQLLTHPGKLGKVCLRQARGHPRNAELTTE
jgi:hypothetical protein